MAGHGPGFHPHLPGFRHQFAAKALGATMWFWLFYRLREDGSKLLMLSHPWETHGHGAGIGPTEEEIGEKP